MSTAWALTYHELDAALATADPAAFLVSPRILRRVIRQLGGLEDPGIKVPHGKCLAVRRDELRPLVDPSELGPRGGELPEWVLLLQRPEPDELAAMSRPRVLLEYWRLLFHARLHAEFDRRVTAGELTPALVAERIEQLNPLVFAEARQVLRQEELLLPPGDDLTVYIEFAVTYLELRHFSPRLLANYFPSLESRGPWESLLALDVDAERWFQATQLHGSTPHYYEEAAVADEPRGGDSRRLDEVQPRKQSERVYCRLMEWADRASAAGNDVSSALLRWRAALSIGPKLAIQAREAGRQDLDRLARRLGRLLSLASAEVQEWSALLAELLPQCLRGFWTAEARLLYDLQKGCLDHERGVYRLDLWAWLRSRGQTPLKSFLPCQRDALIVKHLHAALQRLPVVRLGARSRERLAHLLSQGIEHRESLLRRAFRPGIEAALTEYGLVPSNRPEVVARDKIVEELLDHVCEHGFLNMGHLRDAISRNQLKLRDLSGPQEMLRGDQLLGIDRRLKQALAGVYRPGEVYLRGSQMVSALAFGTATGRFLTRYLFLPFGGAYVGLFFVIYLIEEFYKLTASDEEAKVVKHALMGNFRAPWLCLGLFFLLLNNAAFRRATLDLLRGMGQVLHLLLIGIPRRLREWPPIKRLLAHRWFRRWERYFFKPAVFVGLLASAWWVIRDEALSSGVVLGLFLGVNVALNSRWGRNFDEWLTDLALRSWHQFRFRFLGALWQALDDAFHDFLEGMERFLYSVDEFLRFRGGESRETTAFKAVAGGLWRIVDYVLRFCITLLVEPQINPIKHFPVVTVSHKIILPLFPYFAGLLEPGLGKVYANTIVLSTIWLIPGVFGFLVWELKENWRLYAANRSRTLRPVKVGHHGETLARLLRPGFHSGTIPKLFDRLRKSDRLAQGTGSWRASRKFLLRLEQARHGVERFIERELLALLAIHSAWRETPLALGGVRLGTNNLRIALEHPAHPDQPAVITLEERAGWLLASLRRPGWIDTLSVPQSTALTTALAGWYHLAGVDLVREQIESCFAPPPPRYDLREAGLVILPDGDREGKVLYELRRDVERFPLVSPASPSTLPTLDRRRLVFSASPLEWSWWCSHWDRNEPSVSQMLLASEARPSWPEPTTH